MVALTGIEPAGCRFREVQFGLSSCVFSPTQFANLAETRLWTADVLPRCCPTPHFWATNDGESAAERWRLFPPQISNARFLVNLLSGPHIDYRRVTAYCCILAET